MQKVYERKANKMYCRRTSQMFFALFLARVCIAAQVVLFISILTYLWIYIFYSVLHCIFSRHEDIPSKPDLCSEC